MVMNVVIKVSLQECSNHDTEKLLNVKWNPVENVVLLIVYHMFENVNADSRIVANDLLSPF